MNRQYDVMVAGHLCIDIIPRFPDTGVRNIADLMRPGKLVNVENAMISTGGPVSNAGINMKTLGTKVCFCACVGDDVLGQLTVDLLKASGNPGHPPRQQHGQLLYGCRCPSGNRPYFLAQPRHE